MHDPRDIIKPLYAWLVANALKRMASDADLTWRGLTVLTPIAFAMRSAMLWSTAANTDTALGVR